MKVTAFEARLLQTLHDLGGEAYGVPIYEHLAQTGKEESYGAIYAGFERLEYKGMVTKREGEATAERGWRPQLYWRLTRNGQFERDRSVSAQKRGLSWWPSLRCRTSLY